MENMLRPCQHPAEAASKWFGYNLIGQFGYNSAAAELVLFYLRCV